MNNNDKPELVATNVKNNELSDFVGGSKCLLELRKVFEVLALAKRKPTSKWFLSFWMLCPELN